MNIIELPEAFDWHKQPMTGWHGKVYTEDQMRQYAAASRAAALEEAADICDRGNNYDNPMTAGDCADAIRALKGKNNE